MARKTKNSTETITIDLLTIQKYMENMATKEGTVLNSDVERTDSEEIQYAKLKQAVYELMINEHSKTLNEIPAQNAPMAGKKYYTKALLHNIEPKYINLKFEEINRILNNKI